MQENVNGVEEGTVIRSLECDIQYFNLDTMSSVSCVSSKYCRRYCVLV